LHSKGKALSLPLYFFAFLSYNKNTQERSDIVNKRKAIISIVGVAIIVVGIFALNKYNEAKEERERKKEIEYLEKEIQRLKSIEKQFDDLFGPMD